jgi:glycerate kinase
MRFLLAPDSFKESMTALEACAAMEKGIKSIFPGALCIKVPLADGGEGTVEALCGASGGTVCYKLVTGPLGETVNGSYGISGDGKTAIVEIASASGLHLVPLASRNPLKTTSFGTGELIRAALAHPVDQLIIGLGGSATNDGGLGILQALGIRFTDRFGKDVGRGGGALKKIHQIDLNDYILKKSTIKIKVACDVQNPLTGPDGATAVYGPQKGATTEMFDELEAGLNNFGDKIEAKLGFRVHEIPGAGAAGGAGAGLMAFLNARLISGIHMVMHYTDLERKIADTDYVFTGEGSIDRQTLNGKTISGLISSCIKYNKTLVAFAGKVADAELLQHAGINSIPIVHPTADLRQALIEGPLNLEKTVKEFCSRINY